MILANLATLGFRITDVKLLLNTHAHSDHAGGLAELKRLSGAQLLASAQDAGLLESGGHGDFYFAENGRCPAVHVDRRLNDGDQVSLGNHVLTAHMTPGHTNGCTTWTFDVTDSRQRYHVVDVCGLTILQARVYVEPPLPIPRSSEITDILTKYSRHYLATSFLARTPPTTMGVGKQHASARIQ